MMNLYVGNLPYSITEDQLRDAFGAYGEVAKLNLITDKMTGDPKGFAFVEMSDNAAADAAIKGLNDTPIGGRNIKVNQAKPRESRPSGGGGGGGGGGGQSRGPRW